MKERGRKGTERVVKWWTSLEEKIRMDKKKSLEDKKMEIDW